MWLYQRLRPFTPEERSIAVLPFENLSSDKENAYFAEGIQDEILTRLSKIGDLKVISRTSTQHYQSAPKNLREIAKQLGVAHILEGSVQKSADTVRVNVQLIKAASDSHLWSDTFDRKLTDILSVESEVAKTIADQLRAKLTGHEQEVIAAKADRQSGGVRCLPARPGLHAKDRIYTGELPWCAEIPQSKQCNWILTSLLAGRCCLMSMRVDILPRVFNQPRRSPRRSTAGSRNGSPATAQAWRGFIRKGLLSLRLPEETTTLRLKYLEQAHRASAQ